MTDERKNKIALNLSLKKYHCENDKQNDHHNVVPEVDKPWRIIAQFFDEVFHVAKIVRPAC
jgi:hypothetical protein